MASDKVILQVPSALMGRLDKLIDATERSAKAQEDLIALATEERDLGESILGPPLCPCCGTFNPEIHSGGQEGSGEMATFVLVAKCGNCRETFYAVPQGWTCFDNPELARTEIEGRMTK